VTREQQVLLSQFAGRLGLELADDLFARLARHLDLLETWNRSVRLTGDRDRSLLIEKHCADSLAAAALIGDARRVVDVGSGAGFPGLVMALARPDIRVALVESRRKVCSFLSEVVAETAARNAFVVWGRAEKAGSAPNLRESFDLAISRAVAPEEFLSMCRSLLLPAASMMVMTTVAMPWRDLELLADRHAASLSRIVDYRLPTGEHRRIAVFSKA
jgi:16S rRNA (guanine(527)-N(7))-methyltransferase RsmG